MSDLIPNTGYIFIFEGQGFHPNGKVEGAITKAQADAHNKALSEAELYSLGNVAQVGQWGTLFYDKAKGVTTWNGDVADPRPVVNGKSIRFRYSGKEFLGTLKKNADCFNFKRVK